MADTKSMTQISITVDRNLLASVDAQAENEKRSRSNMIGKMLREYLVIMGEEAKSHD